MKKPFRIFSLLLCLVLALACCTACGNSNDNNDTQQSSEEATEPVVIELGAVIDKVYTIVEIDRTKGTCTALLLEEENSYRDGTYTQGRVYDIETQKLLKEIRYTRDSKDRLTKVVYTDPKTNDIISTEEYAYTPDGKLLSSASRDAKGITIDSVTYTYNTDNTYTVATTKDGRLVSIETYNRTDTVISRTDYTYKPDGSHEINIYNNGKLTSTYAYDAEGNETSRSVYTYNADGSFTIAQYVNGVLKNEQVGTAEEVVTQPTEVTTTEKKETLDTDAVITVPTEAPTTANNNSETTTNKNNNNNNNNNDTTTTRPAATTTTQPATDASGGIDMLAQSRIFRSGEYYISGTMEDGGEFSTMLIAVTPSTMYAAVELDFAAMMGMSSGQMAELGFLQAADGKYYLMEASTKTYCLLDESAMAMIGGEGSDPAELFGDISIADAFIQIKESAQPDKTEKSAINGKAVTCYTFNTASGEAAKHYVDSNGRLVRIEDYNAAGQIINCLEIENLSGNVENYMKKVPSDYTQTDLFSFMLTLIGDNGTIV